MTGIYEIDVTGAVAEAASASVRAALKRVRMDANGTKDNRDPQQFGEELLRLAALHRARGTFLHVERAPLSMVADFARGTLENHVADYEP